MLPNREQLMGRRSRGWGSDRRGGILQNVIFQGLLLLSKCAEHELSITNTVFRQADKFKTTWMHPRSKQWHLIDYIIVRQRDLRDVCITRAMRGAECWTDHRLIRAVLKLHIAPAQRKRPKTVRAAFDIAKQRCSLQKISRYA